MNSYSVYNADQQRQVEKALDGDQSQSGKLISRALELVSVYYLLGALELFNPPSPLFITSAQASLAGVSAVAQISFQRGN